MTGPRVVALAGGVGGAKLAEGFQALVGDRLSVIVNTGDDCIRHGLLVMPDHDTVLYNLAGIEQVGLGWGIEGDTFAVMDQMGVYGEETWFRLGDRDLALHVVRTARLRAGGRLTEVCLGVQRATGITASILPMTDAPVATEVRTDDGWLEFQDYFVRRRCEPAVQEIAYLGADTAR
ncbi:MAG: 2-phospho-L-lactate transferase CofD family protein, partial [Chloroflexota bacterium]